ncbi:MAG: choice-of-anchor Q domain-containing protein, partial [Lysobacterales bacterium]
GAFMSAGYNLLTTDDCFATDPTDVVNTDPLLAAPDAQGIRALQAGSPAIDAGAVGLQNLMRPFDTLPCGYRDVRGLGRPQDGNLDGTYECDIGVYEVQGGADIGAPQSALYFDPSRNGEGTSVEILPGNLAFVAQFTYQMDGSGPAWFAGVGEVVGNSVVIKTMQQPQGGVFGAGFDAAAITRPVAGSTSLVFSSCDATGSSVSQGAGVQSFQAGNEADFEDVQVDAVRLTTVVDCQSNAGARSGRSGSFFSPARDGEGIIVEWLTDGTVVIIWYTYDPDGNQFWMISGEATVSGNAVSASMLYPAQSTAFGSQFDPGQIELEPWGTVTLTYNPGCNSLSFDYASTVNGFGSGQYDYSRLTTLDGTTCDL